MNVPIIKRKKLSVPEWIFTLLFVFIGFSMLTPLFWMISTSFKLEADVFEFPIRWIPKRWNAVENYSEVWGEQYNFGLYYWNSIKVTVISTFFQVVISALGAYSFTKIEWKGRDTIFVLYLATMMIPPQVTLVSRFMILNFTGLYNSHEGIILMTMLSTYGVFLLRQALIGIPQSLSESALIDGANHWQIFTRVILPLLKPSIATLTIIKFTWTWNDFQTPLIFLNRRELFTIPLGMKQFADESGSYYSLIMAAAVSSTLPLVIVFLLGQKYVVEGITAGAVKG